jgi:hypothetical protein
MTRDDSTPGDIDTSVTRKGEDVVKEEGKEPGRHDAGTKGPSQRPVGTSDARNATGVDPQDPIDEESPNLQPG